MTEPTPQDVKAARKAAQLTQTQAAQMIHCGLRAWQGWESTGAAARKMHPALFELFLNKTGLEHGDF